MEGTAANGLEQKQCGCRPGGWAPLRQGRRLVRRTWPSSSSRTEHAPRSHSYVRRSHPGGQRA